MASADETALITIDDDPAEADSVPGPADGTHESPSEAGRLKGGFRTSPDSLEVDYHAAGPHHPIYGMEWTSAQAAALPTDPCEHSEDGPTSPRVGRHVQRCGDSAALSRAAGEAIQPGGSVEASAGAPGG